MAENNSSPATIRRKAKRCTSAGRLRALQCATSLKQMEAPKLVQRSCKTKGGSTSNGLISRSDAKPWVLRMPQVQSCRNGSIRGSYPGDICPHMSGEGFHLLLGSAAATCCDKFRPSVSFSVCGTRLHLPRISTSKPKVFRSLSQDFVLNRVAAS